MFSFSACPLQVRADLTVAFRYVWRRLATPGTWWTGGERVAIAAAARTSYNSAESTGADNLPEDAVEAAALLSRTPSAITAERIHDWEERGLDANRYVELIGVAAQLTAVDTFHRAMNLDLEPLPIAEPGDPSQQLPDTAATVTKAWVPMVGPPTIPTALSAVPAEMVALEALHGPLYLSYDEMGDPAVARGLTRPQLELVASRTSFVNECFF